MRPREKCCAFLRGYETGSSSQMSKGSVFRGSGCGPPAGLCLICGRGELTCAVTCDSYLLAIMLLLPPRLLAQPKKQQLTRNEAAIAKKSNGFSYFFFALSLAPYLWFRFSDSTRGLSFVPFHSKRGQRQSGGGGR